MSAIPPGYKQTEAGVIPENWEVKRLVDVCRITTGSKDVNAGNPQGQFPFFTCSRTHTYSDSYSFDTEAILIAGNGDVGNLHYFSGKFEVYQRTYVLMQFTSDVQFLWQQLKANLEASLGLNKIGSSIPYIKKEHLTAYSFYIPTSENEQRAIAGALADADALIAALDKLIAKKRDIKQAAMQQLLTGKQRLPGFSGEWEVKRLGDVCRITTGSKDVNEGNPQGQFPFFTCSRTHTYSDSYSFDTEAILIAGNGDVGNLHYFTGKFEVYQRTYVLMQFTSDVQFLWQQLKANLEASLGLNKIGSSIPYIKKENLTTFSFNIPASENEESAIAEVLSDMDAEITALEQRLDKTKALKQGMMQALLTGRIRLV